jgi:hypothetical protein
MALSDYTDDLNIITALQVDPTEDGPALQAKFDEGPNKIKTWIRNTLIPHINSDKQDKITSGTDAPSGGSDGDIYLRYS